MADQVEVKLNCLSLKRAAPHQKIQESPPKKEARHQIRPQQESSLGNQAVTGFAKYGAGDQFHPPRP
jgi:hypothetical protein